MSPPAEKMTYLKDIGFTHRIDYLLTFDGNPTGDKTLVPSLEKMKVALGRPYRIMP